MATSSGTTIDPEQINMEVKNYYYFLYSSEVNSGKKNFDSFNSWLKIPQVNWNTAKELETQITTTELFYCP